MIEFLGWSVLTLLIFGVAIIILALVDYVRDEKGWDWLIVVQVIIVFGMLAACAVTGTYAKIAWYHIFI